eukprot:1868705-Rhodomonas_salina.2
MYDYIIIGSSISAAGGLRGIRGLDEKGKVLVVADRKDEHFLHFKESNSKPDQGTLSWQRSLLAGVVIPADHRCRVWTNTLSIDAPLTCLLSSADLLQARCLK